MARFNWMRQRVENWANWKVRQFDGGGRFASVNLTDPTPAPTDPYADAPVRPNEEDAWEIDAAFKQVQMPSELKATLECHYLSRYTEAEKLRRLQVAKRTLYDRLDRIDGVLVEHFGTKQAKAKAERQRVEALQASRRIE